MRFATACPSCQAPLSLWRVMLAPTPLHLTCAKCRKRLRVRGAVKGVILGMAVALAAGVVALVSQIGGREALAPAVVAILVAELVTSFLVVNYGRLESRE